jgi:predicted transcriptional regulator
MKIHVIKMSAQELDKIVTRRREFLAALDESPATKPALVERLGTSRSTVDRAIAELERHQLVERPDDEYTLTLAGKQAYERHRAYLDHLENITAANRILASLPPDAPFALEMLDGAEVKRAEPHDPLQPLDAAREVLSEATRLREVSPAIFPTCVEAIGERANGDGLDVDLVAPRDVIDAIRDDYDQTASWAGTDGNQLYELQESPPYALWIVETPSGTCTGLLSNSDTGVRGLILNDDESAAAWALEEYERYRKQATPVDSFEERT